MKIELGLDKRIGVLLPLTSFMLEAVFILEITIKDFFISRHLQRSLLKLKLFSNTKVQDLPTN